MINARSKHISVALQDGRVLVAGGLIAGGGTTNAAEIFDPIANSWSAIASGMVEAQSGATAALLQDGRVAIAGGQNGANVSSTIEIFDPTRGSFAFAGTMSSPRTEHAMTVLQDGRILVAGGFNGSVLVASTDILDPVAGTVSAGPSLAVARFGHSATTLLNGQVVVIGGNNGNSNASQADVTPAELLDLTVSPLAFTTLAANLATAREGHLAILLPNNNNILIAGGTSAQTAVASAEQFSAHASSTGAWTYSFGSAGTMSTARSSFGGSANQVTAPSSVMQRNGIVVVASGNDANGNALNSTEAYGYPTVQTDQSDYSPGATVTITGSGWQPGETVTIQLVESPLIDTHGPFTVQADSNGNIANSSFVTDTHDVGVLFYLTATGVTSGFQAQNTFADGFSISCSPNPVSINSNTTCTATESGNSESGSTITWSVTAGGTGTFTPSSCAIPSGNNSSCSVTYKPTSAPTGSQMIRGTSSKNGTSGSTTLTVNRLTPTVQITSKSPPSSVTGQGVTVSFSVTGQSGQPNPTGNVTITISGSSANCTGTLAPGNPSTGSCSLTPTTVGSQTLTATYNSDGVYNAATGTASYIVAKASTTTTLASSANPSVFGQSVTFTASVSAISPGSGTATGAVTFKDGSSTLGTGTLNGSGQATFSTSSLTASGSPHSITAV